MRIEQELPNALDKLEAAGERPPAHCRALVVYSNPRFSCIPCAPICCRCALKSIRDVLTKVCALESIYDAPAQILEHGLCPLPAPATLASLINRRTHHARHKDAQ
jgi:hypothetical protein